MSRLGVLLLTDRSQLPLGRSLQATVADAVAAGLTHVVLRELDLPAGERAGLVDDLVEVGATVIAAHHWVPGCVGVQLAAAQPTPGPTADRPSLTGRSCHRAAEVRRAAAQGASYATLGPYAATASKPGYGPPLDPGEYHDLPIPTYALGGLTPDNAPAAIAAGAAGVAVMGGVMRAEDPGGTVARLLEVVR